MPVHWRANVFSRHLTSYELEDWAKEMDLPTTEDKAEFVWVDMETTGLDAEQDVSLELGMVLTNGWGEVCKHGAITWLIWREEKFESITDKSWVRACAMADPLVKEMHEKSGLFSELTEARKKKGGASRFLHPQIIEQDARAWLDEMCGSEAKLNLSGANPHFDRKFLARDLPNLESWFHYRNGADASSLREVAKRVNPTALIDQPGKREIHRPLADLADSIKLYRHLLRNLLVTSDPARLS